MSARKYLCPYCPNTFTSVEKHDEHFNKLHRVCPMTGKVQPYKAPSIYAPAKRERPARERSPQPDEVDLFLFDEDERRKPPPSPF